MTDIDAIPAEPGYKTFVVWFDANHDPYFTFYRDDVYADGDARWVNADLYDTGSEDDAPKAWAELCELAGGMNGPHTLVPAAEMEKLRAELAEVRNQAHRDATNHAQIVRANTELANERDALAEKVDALETALSITESAKVYAQCSADLLRGHLAGQKPVIDAADEWHKIRMDRSSDGMSYHRACKALADAVAALPNMQEPCDTCSSTAGGCAECRPVATPVAVDV